jgi:hypothetical protein
MIDDKFFTDNDPPKSANILAIWAVCAIFSVLSIIGLITVIRWFYAYF